MSNLKFTVRNSNNFLAEGKHVVMIEKIVPAQPKESKDWNDRTPQIAITFKGAKGVQFTNWYNLLGYKKYEDLTLAEQQSGKYEARGDSGYAVVKTTGERVVSAIFMVGKKATEANTVAAFKKLNDAGHELIDGNSAKAMNIIANLGYACGLEADESASVEDLHGKTCGITIGPNTQGKNKVKGSFRPTPEQIEEAELV